MCEIPEDWQSRRIPLNLQLFAEEKTEEATPRRRQKAREEGRVPKSNELGSAIVLLSAFVLFKVYFSVIFDDVQLYVGKSLSTVYLHQDLTVDLFSKLFSDTLLVLAKVCLPIMAACLLAGLVANYAQVGILFTTKPLELKFNQLNPIQGIKRMFSTRSLVELLKSIAKLLIIGWVAYTSIKSELPVFATMFNMPIRESLPFMGNLMVSVGIKVASILLILAFADYAYQRYDYSKSLRMSKQEIKEEHKNIEGDPHIKGKIKQKQRQIAMQRMMQDVPKADVVITNPTHFAIAIRYDGQLMPAPIVVAKGVDHVAQKIKEIAKEHNVPTVENRPLAQALYKACDIGAVIPQDMFQAVAEVLAFVYRLKRKTR